MRAERSRAAAASTVLPSLAARAQLGDRAALERLLVLLEPSLRAHITTIVHDGDRADDVLQDTLLRVSRRLGSLREPAWIRAWAYRIATREAVRAARAESRRRHESIDEWDELPEPAAEIEFDDALLDALPRRLDALPRRAQLVLRMRYLQELSQAEIAEALEIPLGTVKSRIAYGLGLLRRALAATD